jgi:hypothetical protein
MERRLGDFARRPIPEAVDDLDQADESIILLDDGGSIDDGTVQEGEAGRQAIVGRRECGPSASTGRGSGQVLD